MESEKSGKCCVGAGICISGTRDLTIVHTENKVVHCVYLHTLCTMYYVGRLSDSLKRCFALHYTRDHHAVG